MQNSWGTGWGDQGFAKLAIEGGAGVCGMNYYIQYMEWNSAMYEASYPDWN